MLITWKTRNEPSNLKWGSHSKSCAVLFIEENGLGSFNRSVWSIWPGRLCLIPLRLLIHHIFFQITFLALVQCKIKLAIISLLWSFFSYECFCPRVWVVHFCTAQVEKIKSWSGFQSLLPIDQSLLPVDNRTSLTFALSWCKFFSCWWHQDIKIIWSGFSNTI